MSTADKKRVREPSPKREGPRDAALRRLCLLDPPEHQDVPLAAQLAGRLLKTAISERPTKSLFKRLATPASYVTAGPELSCEGTMLASWSVLGLGLAEAILDGEGVESRPNVALASILLVAAAPRRALEDHDSASFSEAFGGGRRRRERFESLARLGWPSNFSPVTAAMQAIADGSEQFDTAALIDFAAERLDVAGAPWRILASKTPRPPLDAALRLLFEAKDRACPYVTADQLECAYQRAGGGTRNGAGIVSDLKRQLGVRSIRNATRDDHRPGEYGYRLDAPTS